VACSPRKHRNGLFLLGELCGTGRHVLAPAIVFAIGMMAPCRNGSRPASALRCKSRNRIRGGDGRSVQVVGGNWNLPATTPSTEMSSSRDSQRRAVPPTSSRTSCQLHLACLLESTETIRRKSDDSLVRQLQVDDPALSPGSRRHGFGFLVDGAHRISPARDQRVRKPTVPFPSRCGQKRHDLGRESDNPLTWHLGRSPLATRRDDRFAAPVPGLS